MPGDTRPSTQPYLSTENYILKSLPKDEYERLLPDLEPVELKLGQVLYQLTSIRRHRRHRLSDFYLLLAFMGVWLS